MWTFPESHCRNSLAAAGQAYFRPGHEYCFAVSEKDFGAGAMAGPSPAPDAGNELFWRHLPITS